MVTILMAVALSSLMSTCDVSPGGLCAQAGGQAIPVTSGEYFSFANSGYDAIVDKGRRKPSTGTTMAEDRHLNQFGRRLLIGNTRDLVRNFCLVHWAIRRHLDYVANFRFESTTGNHDFDRETERLWERESRAGTTDVAGRFSLRKLTRLQELMAVVDGDIGWLRITRGTGRLQLIESDRIRSPYGIDTYTDDGWINGVKCLEDLTPLAYGIYRRVYGGTALQFERTIPASQMALRGYWHRIDQARGVSPLASAVNAFRDTYEGMDAALVKAKAQALFGLVIKRWPDRPIGEIKQADGSDGEPMPRGGYDIDLTNGAFVNDMDPGDSMEWLSDHSPSSEWQAYMQFALMIALKSLDIPYSFLDEGHTNFFGSRGAWLLYDRSAEDKREDNAEALDTYTAFKYRRLISQDLLTLPSTVGTVVVAGGKTVSRRKSRQITVDDHPWQHVARKAPWWRPLEEVQANLKAIGGGFTSPQQVCQESDQGDFYENIDAIADALDYAKSKGVTLSFTVPEVVPGLTAPDGSDPSKKPGEDDNDTVPPAKKK